MHTEVKQIGYLERGIAEKLSAKEVKVFQEVNGTAYYIGTFALVIAIDIDKVKITKFFGDYAETNARNVFEFAAVEMMHDENPIKALFTAESVIDEVKEPNNDSNN